MPAVTTNLGVGAAITDAVPAAAGARLLGEGDTAECDGRGDGTDGPLEQLTVNITRRSSFALNLISKLTGDTRTDTVNRALQVYAYLGQVTAHGGSVYVRPTAGTRIGRLEVL